MPYLNRSSYRYAVYVILVIAFLGTLVKSLRPPNDWAEGHWLMTFELGVVKRALPGTILNALNLYQTPEFAERVILIAVLFFLFLFILLLFYVVSRILTRTGWNIPFIFYAVLFMTSPFIVVTGHAVGYFDQIFLSGTILAIGLVLKKRLLLALLILSVLIFVHETVMIVGFPLVALTVLLTHQARSWKGILLLTVPVFLLGLLILLQEISGSESLYTTILSHLRSYPFVRLGRDVLVADAYVIDFSLYLKSQLPYVPQRLIHSVYSLRTYPFILMTLLLLIYGAWSKLSNWRFLAILFCIFVPHTLHLVAFDYQRFWTYITLNAFLVLWICSEVYELKPVPGAPITFAFIVILMINVYGETPLWESSEPLEIEVLRTPLLIVILVLLYLVRPIKDYILNEGFGFHALSTQDD